ncbi:MAG: glycosyltransferase family 2 protein [Opitutus sp.]|nr:glycosyltransferase family 2 protein [Opitutus sp.]
MTPSLSLVIPVYNEAGNLTPLLTTAVEVLTALGRTFEIILVNDGSTDETGAEIAAALARWPQCGEIRLPERRGQAAALLIGLRAARGALIATMDGDGQNDPRDLPTLLAMLESNGLDLACGWRVDRHDSWLRRRMSRLANAVRRGVLDDGVHDAGCQLRVFRREVGRAFQTMELLQSFIPSLAVAAGFRVGEHPVRHYARRHGDSKYGLGRLWWRPALTMLTLRWRMWNRTVAKPR